MLLYISLSALMNLGIGYVLGAGITFSDVLEMLPFRRRKSTDDLDGADALTRPPATKTVEALAESELTSIEEPVADTTKTPEEETTSETSTKTDKPVDVMAGLADFREQLASAGLHLKLNQEDAGKFSDSAQTVQKVNHGYIENAIEVATTLADQGDAASVAASEVIASSVEKVTAMSESFDEHLEGDMTEEVRAEMVSQASAIQETADEAQLLAEEKLVSPAKPRSMSSSAEIPSAEEPQENEVSEAIAPITTEKLFHQIEQALAVAEDDKSLLVASLSADPIVGQEDDRELLAAITQSLDQVIALALEGTQAYSSAAADPAGRPVLLLGDDTFENASQRMECLRQMVEATTFQRGEESFRATVTCAITK